jgi:hypothetical protein
LSLQACSAPHFAILAGIAKSLLTDIEPGSKEAEYDRKRQGD